MEKLAEQIRVKFTTTSCRFQIKFGSSLMSVVSSLQGTHILRKIPLH